VLRIAYDSSSLVVEHTMGAMRVGYPIEATMERRPTPDGLA
jgi:hypothetical protein